MSEKPQRTKESFHQAALMYVEDQLEVLQKYGSLRAMSVTQYADLVSRIERVGRDLWVNSGGEIKG